MGLHNKFGHSCPDPNVFIGSSFVSCLESEGAANVVACDDPEAIVCESLSVEVCVSGV